MYREWTVKAHWVQWVMDHPGETSLQGRRASDSLGTKGEHTLMEEERKRHSCAVVAIRSLEAHNV